MRNLSSCHQRWCILYGKKALKEAQNVYRSVWQKVPNLEFEGE
jgi:hypothetical protein